MDHFKDQNAQQFIMYVDYYKNDMVERIHFKELGRTTSSIENHISVCTKTFSFILFLPFMTKSKAFFFIIAL